MEDLCRIIKRPLITEKGSLKKENENQAIFEVACRANKSEIKKAVEKVFNVAVRNVNTMNYPGKKKRLGKSLGRKSAWKKAYVTLKDGEKIEFFEGL